MRKIHTKTGAASFYIVAFTTLLLSVIVVGFIVLVLAEMARTANNELSQSAYDSALAGVEDAKAAILNYQSCLNQGATATQPTNAGQVTCGEIVYYINNPDYDGCDTVAHILSRIRKDESKEVVIEETTKSNGGSANNMQQAYTCVKINSKLDDYRSNMTETNSSRVVQVRLDNASTKDVKSIRLSWYSSADSDAKPQSLNFNNGANGNLLFPATDGSNSTVPTPPVVSIQMLQSAENFSMEQFEKTEGSTTNRGTLFLVPKTTQTTEGTHIPEYGTELNPSTSYIDVTSDNNITSSEGFLKANDKTAKNLPFAVYCPENANTEFACSVSIGIPKPVGGERNENTFFFIISLPYQRPDTSFALEICNDDFCSTESFSSQSGDPATNDKIRFKNVQFSIDSTGRANDLYRRVEVRVEPNDIYFPYPDFASQLFGLDKEIITTTENGE